MKFSTLRDAILQALPVTFVAFTAACSMEKDDQPITTITDDEIRIANNARVCTTTTTDEVQCQPRVLVDAFGKNLSGATPGLVPDRVPPGGESTCDNAGLDGGALGLCRAWGEALDCERKDMMLGLVHAQAQACAKLADNFTKLSGRALTRVFGVAVIPPTGGTAVLDNVAGVGFPDSAFTQNTYVTVTKTQSADLDTSFLDTAAIYAPIATAGEQIHIDTGAAPPVSDTVTVQVRVLDRLLSATPDRYAVRLFAQLRQGNDDEQYDVFEAFDSTYDPATKTLTAQLPTSVFSNGRTASDNYEAILFLAIAPGIADVGSTQSLLQPASSVQPYSDLWQAAPADGVANAGSCTDHIICPVGTGCTVTSRFQPARKNPVTGVVQPHQGVDYRAADGTQLVAAADGTVERAYTSSTYGNVVIIRHPSGAATLYAHLSELDVQTGDQVAQGVPIGLSGHTGRAKGPHLHFEYVPSGPIIQSPKRIDPEQCVGAGIRVVSASYGAGSCGNPVGNVTGAVSAKCDGLTTCAIFVANSVFGDPSVGCAKDFDVTWRCGNDPGLLTASHGAVFNEGYTVTISCP